jgi:hypothetical protein
MKDVQFKLLHEGDSARAVLTVPCTILSSVLASVFKGEVPIDMQTSNPEIGAYPAFRLTISLNDLIGTAALAHRWEDLVEGFCLRSSWATFDTFVSGAGAATAHSTLRRKNPAGDGGVFRSESGVAVRPARPGLDGRARALSISFRRAKPAWLAGFAFLRKQSAPN